jgi:glycine oxidase
VSKSSIVVGGGIIGLLSAYRLAHAGFSVDLFDPQLAKGATYAAAGMLAPGGEITSGEQSQYLVQLKSRPSWELLTGEIEELCNEKIQIHKVGTLIVGWDSSDKRLVQQHLELATDFKACVSHVDHDAHPQMFEYISPRISEGLLLSDDAWVDPDQVISSLLSALSHLSVVVHHEIVHEVVPSESGVQVRSDSGMHSAAVGVIATGPSALLAGITTSGENVLRPVRGMTVRMQGFDRSTQPMVRAFVRGRKIYLVSRPGGYNVIGASSDESGTPAIEAGELQRLLRDALEVFPALETAEVVETRIGLRPASSNHEPFFEELITPNWAWSSGHYRHGITLAPLASMRALEFAKERTR